MYSDTHTKERERKEEGNKATTVVRKLQEELTSVWCVPCLLEMVSPDENRNQH